jgi:hypothetical protein
MLSPAPKVIELSDHHLLFSTNETSFSHRTFWKPKGKSREFHVRVAEVPGLRETGGYAYF